MGSLDFAVLVDRWFVAFLLTQASEIPLWVALSRRRAPWRRALFAGTLSTTVMHPALWFVWLPLVWSLRGSVPNWYGFYLVSGELLVVVGEAMIYRAIVKGVTTRFALGVSFVANAGSFAIGYLAHSIGLI